MKIDSPVFDFHGPFIKSPSVGQIAQLEILFNSFLKKHLDQGLIRHITFFQASKSHSGRRNKIALGEGFKLGKNTRSAPLQSRNSEELFLLQKSRSSY